MAVTEARLELALAKARAKRDDTTKKLAVRTKAARDVLKIERQLAQFRAKLRAAIGTHHAPKRGRR